MAKPTAHTDPTRRHDFLFLIEVQDGNPNGDPDAGNLPRVDPETMQGLMTDVAIKRRMRDYVTIAREGTDGYAIYIAEGAALNQRHREAYEALGLNKSKAPNDDARAEMCRRYWDVRMFGALMSTGDHNCGQVRGPVQLTAARSIDPIFPNEITITRVTVTDEKELKDFRDSAGTKGKEREMGRKSLVPYGLYLGRGFFTPAFAQDTSATTDDLQLLWDALINCWDLTHSASRGAMACRALHIFSHSSSLGDAPAHRLFDAIDIHHVPGITAPRDFTDYNIKLDDKAIPAKITHTTLD
jgi:CRISPR-associated protein Csd2